MGAIRKIRNFGDLLYHMTCQLPKYNESIQVVKVSDTETVIIWEDQIHESIINPNSLFKQYRKLAIENGTFGYDLAVFKKKTLDDGIRKKCGRKLGSKDTKPRIQREMTPEHKELLHKRSLKYYASLIELAKPDKELLR